ncbi:Domain of unknown function (DUF4179) [Romboutsia ilealis]|uniref:DUF4179 domain-containing protein n=1 Tax=Romboutsia ilealis TaxID=1115758 RepID=A0A1V1I3D0_9FIRM|nr:DUF4179 domain-containing protein [Romboutsia ilealis]CED93934.1 Domain of unknown function (DUF4179) [Romboutsia ilealis]
MKDKYSILNDVKVNIDEYEEVKFDNNDNIKQRMKKKLRNRKPSYRNAIAVVSAVILGSSVMLNENVWAQVQSIWYTIDEVFSLKKEEVKDYTYNIDKTVEDKNIKILFKSIMLDDGKLIIDANIDDTKFNPFEDFTQKQQKDWSVDKWGNKETRVLLGADSTEIYVDGVKLTYFNNSAPNSKDKNDDKTTDVLIEQSIEAIESDKGEYYLEKVNENQFPNNIDVNKMYNFKIKINKLHIVESEYTEEESKTSEGSYGAVVEGDWGISVDIKGEDLINASTNYEINKDIDLELDDRKINVSVDNISISPIYLGLDYSYIDEDGYSIEFKVFNDKGEEYRWISIESDSYIGKTDKANFEMKLINSYKDTKYIKLVPTIIHYQKGKTLVFEDKSIEIEINK